MALVKVSLDDKWELESGRVFLTGSQALVRLLILQRQRDRAAGLNTAGFVSGYRGSPLGGVDQALWKAEKFLKRAEIHFQPGLNEDLAATSIWGTQQVNMYPDATRDGVFAMWYGKGPGVDRSGDVFKHANYAGTSKYGGVLLIAGDDHAAKSSTLPHQSDHMFSAAIIPVLNPAGVQEFLDLGIHAWAMSRYSGCYVAMKAISDTVETSASVYVDPERVKIDLPTQEEFPLPEGGVSIRWPDPPLVQEQRIQDYKIYAALAYCRKNKLNRIVIDTPTPRLGIITSGKSYLDVLQAFDDLGIDEMHAAEIGIRLFKVAMSWPLEPEGVRQFAEGLEEILVVEEKRHIIEYQLKEQLYNWSESARPRVIGKFDEKGEWALPHGEWLLPAHGELTPAMIARVIAARIGRFYTSELIVKRLAFLETKERALTRPRTQLQRVPYFCSGCPHNTSTNVPEGSRAMAGIGCHYMANWMPGRRTQTASQMGGEGVAWIGQAPFTNEKHVFANLGDGTYYHSGLLAIRAAVAAKVNITYKILYNDAVAMTGGQPMDGPLSPRMVTEQVLAEGVKRVVVVSDEPEQFAAAPFPASVPVRHRDELDTVQRELREVEGTTVLLYVQTCAAEKRRRRKRGAYPDLPKRVYINELVCEGCGDCGVKSNCVSVLPLETEFGRKRLIDQSSCNKDYSCVKGFCPSFVTVEGGTLRKPSGAGAVDFPALPEPKRPSTTRPFNILVTGIGGTGVVTVGALLGMAAHLEGKGVSVLDITGLAQKNGAVLCYVRIADRPEDIHATRIAAGDADAVIACDLLVAVSDEALAKMQLGVTRAAVNASVVMPASFTGLADLQFPMDSMESEVTEAVGRDKVAFVNGARLATSLLGDSMATNPFMLGYAYQMGMVPLSEDALMRAIELNGAAIDMNKRSFQWGRWAAVEIAKVETYARPRETLAESLRLSTSLEEIVSRRVAHLTAYQNAAYAKRYTALVERVRGAERAVARGSELAEAVARYYFKLLAIKDEYEVARLFTDGEFERRVAAVFEGEYQLHFHLAPPLWAKPDPRTGETKKREYGPWMRTALRLLARMKGLRGTALDLFAHSSERKLERRVLAEYEATVEHLLQRITADNLPLAVAIASLPEQIRGYGPVRESHVRAAKQREQELLARFDAPALRTLATAKGEETVAA